MPNNIKTNFRQEKLKSKILSEGYCCLHGYLRLCQARSEHPIKMAENIGRHKSAIYSNYRALKEGKRPCQKLKDCLLPIIEEIQKSP